MKCHEVKGEEGSAEGGTSEGDSDKGEMGQGGFVKEEGETELGKEKCDAEKESRKRLEMLQKQPTNGKGAIKKTSLSERCRLLSIR